MKHPRTQHPALESSLASDRGTAYSRTTEPFPNPRRSTNKGNPIDQCYRALVETSNSPILLLSPDAIILSWNPAAERLSGWMASEALGRSYAELCLVRNTREPFMAVLAQAVEGKMVRGFKSALRTRSGLHMTLAWNISSVREDHGTLIGLIAVGEGTLPHQETETTLHLTLARQQETARHAQRAAEEERRKLARELHDEFGQALTGMTFDLAWLSKALSSSAAPLAPGAMQQKVRALSQSVSALLASVHSTVASLRPAMLDDLGLVPALEHLTTTFQQRTGAHCTIDIAPELSSTPFPPDIATALFRIAQELLTNVMRHAAATRVKIRLSRTSTHIELEVSDNGTGIACDRGAHHSFGLRGMHERTSLLGGNFRIAGAPGAGTTAIASVPVTANHTL